MDQSSLEAGGKVTLLAVGLMSSILPTPKAMLFHALYLEAPRSPRIELEGLLGDVYQKVYQYFTRMLKM
ncbi:hypothetical protein V2J09_003757 [Rumex salicifolius]